MNRRSFISSTLGFLAGLSIVRKIGLRSAQTVTATPSQVTGGTFTFAGSKPIAWNATAEEIQSAIEGLHTFARGNVAVERPDLTGPITISFVG